MALVIQSAGGEILKDKDKSTANLWILDEKKDQTLIQ